MGCAAPPPDPPFEARLLRGHEAPVTAVATRALAGTRGATKNVSFNPSGSLLFSPDGKVLLVSSDGEQAARLLEVPGLREMRRLAWSNDAHVFSPDSTKLVSVVGNTWLVVTDVEKGRELASLWAGERLGPFSLHFSPGGRFLVSETGDTDGATRFFDASTWKKLAAVGGTRVVFSRDGARAAWPRGSDGVVCVADAPR